MVGTCVEKKKLNLLSCEFWSLVIILFGFLVFHGFFKNGDYTSVHHIMYIVWVSGAFSVGNIWRWENKVESYLFCLFAGN